MKKLLTIFLFFVFVLLPFKVFANTIKVGVLIDLSGSLATFGNQIEQGLKWARNDINAYLIQQGKNYDIKFYVEDTQLNPLICLKKAQLLRARGVDFVIGPISSSELKSIRNFVNNNKLVLISFSTAIPQYIGFFKPNDKKYVFRIVPNDTFQGKVLAKLLRNKGIKNLLIIYRRDTWGEGLKKAVLQNLNNVHLIKSIEYPSTPEPADWCPYIQIMHKALKSYDPKDTAILAIGFEELATMLSQIPPNSNILKYSWFGTDGIAGTNKILREAVENGIKVKFYSTLFTSRGEGIKRLVKKYGSIPPQYFLNSYDSLWLGVLAYVKTLEQKGNFCPDSFVNNLREIAILYTKGDFGVQPVSGDIIFNEWNDRITGNYGIYVITKNGWKLLEIWYSNKDKFERVH